MDGAVNPVGRHAAFRCIICNREVGSVTMPRITSLPFAICATDERICTSESFLNQRWGTTFRSVHWVYVCRCRRLPAIILSSDEIALRRIWDIEPRLASVIRQCPLPTQRYRTGSSCPPEKCHLCKMHPAFTRRNSIPRLLNSLSALRLARHPLAIAGYT
jgi:hypothetical protein